MKYKCPACGYQPNKAQAMMETKLLFKAFPEDIQKNLKRVIKEVNKYSYKGRIPVEYKYRFIYGLSPVSHEIIRKTIAIWDRFDNSKKCFTLQYFSAIAKNSQETNSSKEKSEIKMRGINPPDLTVKEKPKTKENAKHARLNKRATPKRRGPKF